AYAAIKSTNHMPPLANDSRPARTAGIYYPDITLRVALTEFDTAGHIHINQISTAGGTGVGQIVHHRRQDSHAGGIAQGAGLHPEFKTKSTRFVQGGIERNVNFAHSIASLGTRVCQAHAPANNSRLPQQGIGNYIAVQYA